MSETDPTELEATVIHSLSIIFELLMATDTVKPDVLALMLDHAREGMLAKGHGQSAGHMIHFREFVLRRAGERAEAQSLLREPPKGTA